MSGQSRVYKECVASLSGSIDLVLSSVTSVQTLDRRARVELLNGDIDHAECDRIEATIRRLVDALVPTILCLLAVVELEELFEGDPRIETLRRFERDLRSQQ